MRQQPGERLQSTVLSRAAGDLRGIFLKAGVRMPGFWDWFKGIFGFAPADGAADRAPADREPVGEALPDLEPQIPAERLAAQRAADGIAQTPMRAGGQEPQIAGAQRAGQQVAAQQVAAQQVAAQQVAAQPARAGLAQAAAGLVRRMLRQDDADYALPEIMAMPPEAWRARALRMQPWRSPWIGQTHVIPPASDERTALIDRGLVLRGLLSAEELAEIHRIGDLHRAQHSGAAQAAAQAAARAAAQAGEAAVAALRAERAAARAMKRGAAAALRAERAAGVAQRRRGDIVFLGRGVSGTLSERTSDAERLAAAGLPVLQTPAEVAALLGLSVPALRWLTFHREAAERVHYVRFSVPKRAGGLRQLSAPLPRLKAAQRAVLEAVLSKLPPHPAAQGFVKGRSILTNAQIHTGQAVVVCLDIRDFFPSIRWRRVRRVFAELGYSGAVATVLALLCTEAPRQRVEWAGGLSAPVGEPAPALAPVPLYIATGPRALPQGAPTSPALSNLVMADIDARVAAWAEREGWRYSRYADDLIFSSGPDQAAKAHRITLLLREALRAEGLAIHPAKTRRMRRGRRQTVTGLVVNDRPGLPREEVRRLRAILHGASLTGLEAQNREGRPRFAAWLRGKLALLEMVDPARGARMRGELDRLEGRAGGATRHDVKPDASADAGDIKEM